MTSNIKIAANCRNSRKSSGPRSAAGKSIASRNAMRHGLAAIALRQSGPSDEIDEFAGALCGDDRDPALFAQAVKIAENEMTLRAIRAQQIAVIERLREPYVAPFSRKDNSLELAKGRSFEEWLAHREIRARVPELLQKYKDQIPPPELDENSPEWCRYVELIPLCLKVLLQEPDDIAVEIRERARKRIEERDEHEALAAAVGDLIRLDRYQRRAWSRQKRAIREFIRMKTTNRNIQPTSAAEQRVTSVQAIEAISAQLDLHEIAAILRSLAVLRKPTKCDFCYERLIYINGTTKHALHKLYAWCRAWPNHPLRTG